MTDVTKTRALWLSLHTFSHREKVRHHQLSFITNWFVETKKALGCESCWRKVIYFCNHWPVDYGEDLYLWSLCLHDYVNKEMGKSLFFPELTLAPLASHGIIQ